MTRGRINSHSNAVFRYRAATARRARLVLASATIRPNWIISGNLRNWGAPPDSVMTVAIVIELTIVADEVAANAASHSRSPGIPSRATSEDRIEYEITAINAKFARLNAIL